MLGCNMVDTHTQRCGGTAADLPRSAPGAIRPAHACVTAASLQRAMMLRPPHRNGTMARRSTCCCSQRDDRLSSTRLLQALVHPRSASAAHSATPGAVLPEACVAQRASPSGGSHDISKATTT
jgi:hypothetical protein